MLEFIKKYRYVLLSVVAVVSIGLNIYFLTDSRIKSDIIHGLEQTNGFLDGQLKEAKEDEKSYLKEIKEKNKTIAALDKKLSEAVRNYRQLKEEMAALRQPENPRDFKDLDECREKYTELSRHLKLSLDFGKETETTLTLCLEKSNEQQELILLSENAFNECQKQGKLKDIKIEALRASFNDLDRFFKRKRLKRSLFQYTAGAIIGGVATYFILKRNR